MSGEGIIIGEITYIILLRSPGIDVTVVFLFIIIIYTSSKYQTHVAVGTPNHGLVFYIILGTEHFSYNLRGPFVSIPLPMHY